MLDLVYIVSVSVILVMAGTVLHTEYALKHSQPGRKTWTIPHPEK